MNLFNRIDRYFSTPTQRRSWIVFFFALAFFWQNIWNLLVSVHLCALSDYDSLFAFYRRAELYDSSWMVRLIVSQLSEPAVNPIEMLAALAHSMDFSAFVILVCGLILLFSPSQGSPVWFLKRARTEYMAILLLQSGAVLLAAFLGLHAGSLGQALVILKGLGLCELVLSFAALFLSAAEMLENGMKIIKDQKTG